MGASYYKLDIEHRKVVGKKATKALRKGGKVPSVLYYKGEEPLSLYVDKQLLYKAMKSDQRIYEIDINSESQYVMIKEIQYHPVTDEVIHLDFMRVRRSEKITISVPIILVGKSIGVTEGGILTQPMTQIEISCLPTNVPDHVEVNIDNLGLNASISVADISIDDGDVEIISSDDLNVASVITPREEEEPVLSDEDESGEATESAEGDEEKTGEGGDGSKSDENKPKDSN
jgi:large subunit ribosomal protein L25